MKQYLRFFRDTDLDAPASSSPRTSDNERFLSEYKEELKKEGWQTNNIHYMLIGYSQGLEKAQAAIQWLQNSGVREGTREAELEKCLGEIVAMLKGGDNFCTADYSEEYGATAHITKQFQTLLTKAKSLLSKSI